MNGPTEPGGDELRIQAILKARGVGPDAVPPAVPPRLPDGFEPDGEPQAWWSHERPHNGAVKDEATEEQNDRPPAFVPQPGYWPHPHTPAALTRMPERAAAAISPGTRRLLYNATAAGTGWLLGLYDQFARAIADCGQQSISGALVLGLGGTALIAHVWDRRTRHWWPGIAWAARIPLATAILAVALWAPAAP